MALLDHLTPLTPRPLPLCTSCGTPFSFDRAVLVVEQAYADAGNCPDCCEALVESDRRLALRARGSHGVPTGVSGRPTGADRG